MILLHVNVETPAGLLISTWPLLLWSGSVSGRESSSLESVHRWIRSRYSCLYLSSYSSKACYLRYSKYSLMSPCKTIAPPPILPCFFSSLPWLPSSAFLLIRPSLTASWIFLGRKKRTGRFSARDSKVLSWNICGCSNFCQIPQEKAQRV